MTSSTVITSYLGFGTAASRPSSPNVPSGCLALYYATDTGVLSGWTGSSWSSIIQEWSAGTVSAVATGLSITSGTLVPEWSAGTVSVLGNGLAINSGTIEVAKQGTITATTGTNTITPASGTSSWIINGPSAGGSVTLVAAAADYPDQAMRLVIVQGSTAATWTLGTGFSFGANITSFTATASASARDIIQLISNNGTVFDVMAINQGFTA